MISFSTIIFLLPQANHHIMYNWKELFVGILLGTLTQVAIILSGYKILLSPIPCSFVHFFTLLIFTFTRKVIPYHKLFDYNWKEFFFGLLIGTLTQVAIRLSGYKILLSPIPCSFVHLSILLIFTFTRKILDPKYSPFTSAICKETYI